MLDVVSQVHMGQKPDDELLRRSQDDLARWYQLIDHPVQRSLVEDRVRFPVVPAGRRSGKTERLKRYVAREAMTGPSGPYFLAAPTYGQAKKIFWEDMKRLCLTSLLPKKPSESELIIYLPANRSVHLIGLDKPERFEGIPWVGGGIDEIASIKGSAWATNIKPALDTINPERPSHRAWCWLIGVPEGLNHYFDLAEYARTANDPEWKLYTWKSADILPPDVIDSARRTMSLKQFRQEYEASFETAQGRVYEDYGQLNETDRALLGHEEILWMHDFNYTPMSSAIGVRKGEKLYIVDEIVLESAVARQTAEEFVVKFDNHKNKKVLLYGDPAGRAGEKHDHASDYTEIETVLCSAGWDASRRVKKSAPAIRDRQNSVRAKILKAASQVSLFVNPGKAKYTHKGLQTVQIKEGSTFLEKDSDYQHITTAVGYCVDYEWPVRPERVTSVTPIQSAHNWR